jgi:putative transposase
MNKQFTEEFKIQAVKQVTEQGYTAASVSERLGVSTNSLYNCIFRQRVKEKYAFIKSRLNKYPVRLMCQVLNIQRSGFYAWIKKPKSASAIEDERLLGLIKHSWLESGCVYGYRKVQSDLRDLGETCSRHRVARLMRKGD